MTDSQINPKSKQNFFDVLIGRLPSANVQLVFWSILLIGLAVDLYTKQLVFKHMDDNTYIPIIDNYLRLVTVHNDGAAFGIFAGHLNWLITVSFIALIAVMIFFLFGGVKEKIMNVALALFAAGICGNLYDRVFHGGRVRDFIDVGINDLRWPAFNLADSFLCIAVGLMLIAIYLTERPCRKRAQQQK